MDKKAIALGAALLIAAGAANAELKAFKVNGETVSVAEQKAVYDRAVAQGPPDSADCTAAGSQEGQDSAECRRAARDRQRPQSDPHSGPCSGLGQEEPGKRC